MADNQAGIMALPENQDMQKLSIYDSYDATNEALTAARPDVAQDIDAEMAPLQGIADDFTNEQLDLIIELVQYLYENREEYAKNIAEFVSEVGIEGVFPPEYDPNFLSTFNSILLRERKSRGADQPPFPEKFARGGIAEAARIVAGQGRYGDTMLAHITPEEARMLRRQGGSGSINPVTGLPEYWNIFKEVKKAVKGVGKVVSGAWKATVGKVLSTVASATKKVLASPIGRMAVTIGLTVALGPGGSMAMFSSGWAAAATVSGGVTLASGGSVKDAFKAAAFAAIAAPDGIVGSYIGPTTQAWAGSNEFAKAAMRFGTSAAATTTAALVTGENLQDSVRQGLTSAAIDTGVNLAQKGLNLKSASKEVTELADVNKGKAAAEYMAARSANPDIELENDQAWWKQNAKDAKSTFEGARAGIDDPTTSTTQAEAIKAANARLGNPALSDEALNYGSPSYGLKDGPTLGFDGEDVLFRPKKAGYVGLSKPVTTADKVGILDTGAYDSLKGSTSSVDIAAGGKAPPYEIPTIGGSFKKMGSGIADLAQGKFKDGFGNIVQGAEDLFLPSDPTPAQIADFEATNPKGIKAVEKFAAGPPALRTYGPGVAAGLGIAGLSGAFDVPEPPKPEQQTLLEGTPGQDLISKDPKKYLVQNMSGVDYGEKGEILGPSDEAPRAATIEDIRVNPAGDLLTLQDIARPTGNYGSAPVGQNQSPFIDPYQYWYQQLLASQGQQPRYYAMGGITSLPAPMQAPPPAGIAALREGGNSNYPRRTGQISGPGTEKSDSIPAMLSDGEFVMTASAVRGLGKGSRREGAKRMYALMHQLERNAARG
jgi:hypothetical protein